MLSERARSVDESDRLDVDGMDNFQCMLSTLKFDAVVVQQVFPLPLLKLLERRGLFARGLQPMAVAVEIARTEQGKRQHKPQVGRTQNHTCV